MSLLGFEARLLGWAAILTPPLGIAALGFFGILAHVLGAPQQSDRILSAVVQVGPLVGGIGAASAVATDRTIELRLSLPVTFRRSVAIRLGLALGWAILVTAGATALVHTMGWLTSEIPDAPASDHLEWLSPMLMLVGVGATATAASRVTAAGVGLVAVVWVFSNLLSGVWRQLVWLNMVWPQMPFDPAHPSAWYWNRFWLGVIGVAGMACAAWLLGRAEHLLGGER